MLSDKVTDPNAVPSVFTKIRRGVGLTAFYLVALTVIAGCIAAGLQHAFFDDHELAAVSWEYGETDEDVVLTFHADGACWVNPLVTSEVVPSFAAVKVKASAVAFGDCSEGVDVQRDVALGAPVGERDLVDRHGDLIAQVGGPAPSDPSDPSDPSRPADPSDPSDPSDPAASESTRRGR